MRPEGRGPLDSLYFAYPHFAARRAPEQDGAAAIHPVVIVGAGPVGLTAALTLAKYGVRSVVLDAKATFNDGSRAICVARQSFHILEQVGAVAPFLAKALGWTTGRSFYRGEEIYRFDMPDSDHEKFRPMYNLQQQYIEQFLHDACVATGLVDLRWQSTVVGIDSRPDGATLAVETPLGGYSLRAAHVLAADGARSAIRSQLGLRLKGENYEGRYVIADVRMDHAYPTERRALFEPASNPGGTVLIHRQPDDIWRIDYQLRDGENPDEAIGEANIRTRVGAILAEIGHQGPWELEWWSIYTANTLALDDYRHGRVTFIGDSAHIVPIFGVRGLNNGLADAQNIGWKLAYVLKGQAGEALLDSYTPERRGATLDVFANAGKSARFMTPPTRGHRLVREAVLSLAATEAFARDFANPRQMQPHTYADSPLTPYPARDGAFSAGPASGAALANVRLPDGRFLSDLVGAGFTALVFANGPVTDSVGALLEALAARDSLFRAVVVGEAGDLPAGTVRIGNGGDLAERYGATGGAVYLIRPDLHVAGRWKTLVPAEVVSTLDACLGRTA
ncbi:MAG: FAD-dependent monooxygenase [Phreatobacter sp.]|uniref:FAD-dependent monooxygenase n=1 Tax=Phreatobacter sp. TaxID=1966341 RepID=UPI001A508A6A|nr:FAD-dependent monooxygenase [Phreatobacter sp.]MBL8568420.1 FAD-dependent monooxygenase [Phreatobacter sp.]